MTDIQKLSDEELAKALSFYSGKAGEPECVELVRRLKIMRELCEAAADNWKPMTFQREIDAYRQME